MTFRDFPIKSVIISGNLQSKLTYKLCPITEFSEGVWNLSLVSLAYFCNLENIDYICSISCNLITSQKYNTNNQVELYDQPLGIFVLKTGSKTTKSFEKTWFYINALSSDLNISVKNQSNQEDIKIDCEFHIQLFFQRVK